MKAGVARSKVSFVDPAKFTPHFSWKRSNGGGLARHRAMLRGRFCLAGYERIWDTSVFVQQGGDY